MCSICGRFGKDCCYHIVSGIGEWIHDLNDPYPSSKYMIMCLDREYSEIEVLNIAADNWINIMTNPWMLLTKTNIRLRTIKQFDNTRRR